MTILEGFDFAGLIPVGLKVLGALVLLSSRSGWPGGPGGSRAHEPGRRELIAGPDG